MRFLRILKRQNWFRKPSEQPAHDSWSNRYPSILAPRSVYMEENSTRWLALREASRRILVEENLTISVPHNHIATWHRLMLNIADSMPHRLEFPSVIEGMFAIQRNQINLFDLNSEEPMNKDVLWLPYEQSELIVDLIQMCSELLLAGYPGCTGCGYQDDEDKWDEIAHRTRLKNSEE